MPRGAVRPTQHGGGSGGHLGRCYCLLRTPISAQGSYPAHSVLLHCSTERVGSSPPPVHFGCALAPCHAARPPLLCPIGASVTSGAFGPVCSFTWPLLQEAAAHAPAPVPPLGAGCAGAFGGAPTFRAACWLCTLWPGHVTTGGAAMADDGGREWGRRCSGVGSGGGRCGRTGGARRSRTPS